MWIALPLKNSQIASNSHMIEIASIACLHNFFRHALLQWNLSKAIGTKNNVPSKEVAPVGRSIISGRNQVRRAGRCECGRNRLKLESVDFTAI